MGECRFVFNRIWKATMNECNHNDSDEDDHHHTENQRFPNDILISDLFHIIHYAGILLNKKEPLDDDTRPFDEYMKYAKSRTVIDEETNERMDIESVKAEDVPKILLGVFIGQEDEKRIDAAELIAKF